MYSSGLRAKSAGPWPAPIRRRIAFQPVVFLGYGSRVDDTDELRGLRRQSDGFFVKLSYLFRL